MCHVCPLPIVLVVMTGLSDLVMLLIGKLYGKIQEHAPLPTFILALVRHFISLSEALISLTHVRLYLFYTAHAQILPEI